MFIRTFLLSLILLYQLNLPGCAQAAPNGSLPQPAPIEHVTVTRWMSGLTLGPGESGAWFEDNVDANAVRYFTPVAIGKDIDQPPVEYDQKVEVTHIINITKGNNHSRDGTGGALTVQVNVTVTNLDREHPARFDIYKAELK